jgi:ribose transport system ATP-binding protein
MGSGRSRLLRTLFADQRADSGALRLNDGPYPRSVPAAIRAGIAYLPEDRGTAGVFSGWELWRNMTLPYLRSFSRFGFLPRPDRERAHTEKMIDDLSIKTASTESAVRELSGGNAQKVSLGRWLRPDVDLLLLDEPTVGVDVGAKADILAAIRRMAGRGRCAVVVASSDVDELLAVADRLLVLRSGEVAASVPTEGLDEADVLNLISGHPVPGRERSA